MSENRDSILLFSYFKGHGDGLHLAWSDDGLSWEAFNQDEIFITPNTGNERIMRDPFVILGRDGLFHLVWTCGWHERGIGYSCSPDLVSWSAQQYIPVMEHEPDARNCWAPEIFYDEPREQYVIYWATTIPGRFPDTDPDGDDGLNHRIYYVTTRDFKTFSDTKLFFDPGFNVIDATLMRDDSRYIIFMKNETLNPCEKNIRFAVSEHLFLGFETISAPVSGPYWAEGPTAIKIANVWYVYFDKYKVNEIGALRTIDFVSWEDVSHAVVFPKGAQHGAVSRVPFKLVKHLF